MVNFCMRNLCFIVFMLALLFPFAVLSAVETVPPLSGGYSWSYQFAPETTERPTALESCISFSETYINHRLDDFGVYSPSNTPQHYYKCYATLPATGAEEYRGFILPTIPVPSAVCPVDDPPYTYSITDNFCSRTVPDLPTCVIGTQVGVIGIVHLGTYPGNLYPYACSGGCSVEWQGGTLASYRQLIDGVYHYYTDVGWWKVDSEDALVCGSSNDTAASAVASIPSASCASGQSLVTGSNGFSQCYDDSTGIPSSTASASAVAAATASSSATAQDVGAQAAASVAAAGGDNAAQESARSTAIAAFVAAAGSGEQQIHQSFCTLNPSDPSCSGVGSQVQFPSDYARTGEAEQAGLNLAASLAPQLDTIANQLTETSEVAEPDVPLAEDMPDWGSTLSDLSGWQLPVHSSTCPTASLDLSSVLGAGSVYSFDAHCGLITDNFQVIQAAMMLVWTIMALMIVLRS